MSSEPSRNTTFVQQQQLNEDDHLNSISRQATTFSQNSSSSFSVNIKKLFKKQNLKCILILAILIASLIIIKYAIFNPLKGRHPGASYDFPISFEEIINKTDIQKIFGKRKSKQGITKQQLFQAIRKLEITNNVKYGGQIQVNMTKLDPAKYQKLQRIKSLINQQNAYLDQTYNINEYNKKQLPFCIVVPSYQNVQNCLYLRNLNSIFMQNYTNYHVVYIDDKSPDNLGNYLKLYINKNQIPKDKLKIITNQFNRKPIYSIYNAINNHCKLGQLALIVEGDDALIGTNVLKLYNAIYQKEKCAMIYSSYLDVIDNTEVELGVAHQVLDQFFKKNAVRTIYEIPGRYLLSFYVDVFKSIKQSDFQDDDGHFMWFAYDRAIITPLLQITYPRIKIVKEILYEHRRTPATEESKDWKRQSNIILAKQPYKPLKFFPFIERNKYKYFFEVSIQNVIKNTDFSGYTIGNNFQIQGISKSMHMRAIKQTQLIHNVKYNGQISIQLASYQKSKEQKYKRIQKLIAQDRKYYNQKYDIDYYRQKQLPFCIVTPSYNNVKSGLYLRNLDSVFMQDYNNYHVVYIDDCSPDKTGQYVYKYLQQKKIPKKHIQVIINKQNKKAMYNIYMAIHKFCNLGQIVVIIDGDDSFIGRNVLALYNAVYQRDGAAMAYSNFLTIHNNDRTQLGFCHEIDTNLFEQNIFRTTWNLPGTHLMSFYTDLFRKIKLTDLTYENGTFYDYAYDRAIVTPLLQMAYPRISVIKQITYQYRNDTGINDAPDDWIRVSHIILDKEPYAHLQEFEFIFKKSQQKNEKNKLKQTVQSLINNTDFSQYNNQKEKKVNGITLQQHIHGIKLTQITQNIDSKGNAIAKQNSDQDLTNKKKKIQKILKQDQQYLQSKYQISKYKQTQLPFCIVVSSYKSIQNGLYWRNINSILMQNYQNYRIIYIDDSQQDQSQFFIKKVIEQAELSPESQQKIKIIKNQNTRLDLANIYYAAHNQCLVNQIMLVVGDNDALLGRNVLNVLNAEYQKEKPLVGYSCSLKVFNGSTYLGKCPDIDDFYFKTNTFRNHLQYEKYRLMSFYTHLFRRIKIRDLTYQNGSFFTNAIDKAIMIPLIEMAYPHVLNLKQIMYEDRSNMNESKDSIQQGTQVHLILSKNPYENLKDYSIQKN